MIIWRKRATRQFLSMLDWLTQEGYQKAADSLIVRTDEIAQKVHARPEIGKPSRTFKSVRSYRIDEHRRLYYSVKGKKLFVVAVLDGRQNPDRNPY